MAKKSGLTPENKDISVGSNDVSVAKAVNPEKIVVTAALPYANGNIHIGHLLEYIQADIYVRFLKSLGQEALYICASDMHGTPIEVNAKKAGKEPEEFALGFWQEHQIDFASFQIKFDNYYKTHSPENKKQAEYFFNSLKEKGYIYIKEVNTVYCKNCARYLPDRFVKGTCPNCTAEGQYGDICESCSSILKCTDLINPKCVICGKTPIQKESKHYFFALSKFSAILNYWLSEAKANIQPEIRNQLKEWITKGLEDWCISRDAPYFGFEIPGSKKETGEIKYFYVWLDAPIGYISSTENYCHQQLKDKVTWEDYWKKGKVHHFIGKDIVYFHYLFWPALLTAMEIPLPTLTTHGFITVNGQKMSKSRGTFFTAKDFLKMYPAEALRFFYASRLDRKVSDVDLNFEEFIAVNNNVLVGSLGNYCYRVLTFAEKNYGEVAKGERTKADNNIMENSVKLKPLNPEKQLEKQVFKLIEEVKRSYQKEDFRSAVQEIIKIADIGNSYFQNSEVWKDKDSAESKVKVGWCVNLARILGLLVAPILPEFSQKIRTALNEKNNAKNDNSLSWNDLNFNWSGKIKPVEKLVKKIEKVPEAAKFPLEMRVGKIIEVKDHPNADGLYLLKADFGSHLSNSGIFSASKTSADTPHIGHSTEKNLGIKQVVAGLKKYLSQEDLLNQKAVFCMNIKPAKIRGEKSEVMIMAPDDGLKVSLIIAEKTPLGEEVNFTGLESARSEITFEDFTKIVMQVQEVNAQGKGKVFFEGKKLSSKVEDLLTSGVKEGARVR